MDKLTLLTRYLRNPDTLQRARIRCNPEKIDSWAENGSAEYLGIAGADGGIYLFEHTYKGVIELEEVAGDIRLLIGLIVTWLSEFDPDRDELDERNLKWEGIPFDDDTSDLQLEVWFNERVYFGRVEAAVTPQIEYRGIPYGLGSEAIQVAENENDPDLVTVELDHD